MMKPQRAGAQRRRTKRRFHNKLETSLGTILDLSADGIRVIATREHKGELVLNLVGPGIDLRLRAQVVWSKKHAFRTYELGLRFLQGEGRREMLTWLSQWCD